jgi:hypothetical protein
MIAYLHVVEETTKAWVSQTLSSFSSQESKSLDLRGSYYKSGWLQMSWNYRTIWLGALLQSNKHNPLA